MTARQNTSPLKCCNVRTAYRISGIPSMIYDVTVCKMVNKSAFLRILDHEKLTISVFVRGWRVGEHDGFLANTPKNGFFGPCQKNRFSGVARQNPMWNVEWTHGPFLVLVSCFLFEVFHSIHHRLSGLFSVYTKVICLRSRHLISRRLHSVPMPKAPKVFKGSNQISLDDILGATT